MHFFIFLNPDLRADLDAIEKWHITIPCIVRLSVIYKVRGSEKVAFVAFVALAISEAFVACGISVVYIKLGGAKKWHLWHLWHSWHW